MDILGYQDITGHRLIDQGHNWKTLCPAHSEKTPSFYIHKDSYVCHCFGCGVKGYLEYVLAKNYDYTAADIRRILNIPLLRRPSHEKVQPEPLFESVWLESFKRIVNHPFLEARGFQDSTVHVTGARWDHNEKRIVFPMRSLGGDIVGAVGRTVQTVELYRPKWKFYWDTKPGEIVWAPPVLDNRPIEYLVEGIFDWMWLYQHGYGQVGALIRAIPTTTQINILKNATGSLSLFLDNDEAGRMGQSLLGTALASSLAVTYIDYPEGKKDPQELTSEELIVALNHKLTYVQYSNRR